MWKLCLVFILGLQSISGQIDSRCPPLNDPNNVVHLPHESDCTLFYKCDWGTPVLFLCQPYGTHWSVALDRCEWPDVANCQLGGSTTYIPTTYPTTLSTISQEITVVPTPDSRCPPLNDPNNVVHLPHESDCTLFYKCNWGTPVLFLCQPYGTHWSVALDRCEWPDVANCQLGGSTTYIPTTYPTTLSTISQEITVVPTPDSRCPPLNDPNNVVHLPHESDCTLFYKCNWGTPVLFLCQPYGTQWSVALDRCEWPDVANCQLGGSTTYIPTTYPTTLSTISQEITVVPTPDSRCPPLNDPNNVVHLPHESDCTLFYKCNWGTPVLFLCQPYGTHWSVALDRCEWPDVANCQLGGSTTYIPTTYPTTLSTISQEITVVPTPDSRCPSLNDPNNVVHLPHESDCTLFYKCDWGTPVLFLCQPYGTHWSVALDRCEWPDVANCQLGGSTTYIPTTYSTTLSTISQEITVVPTPDSRCPPLNDPNNVVHLPHEYDCTLFYKCDWGTPVLFLCQPFGTHWSVALNRCEVPSLAGCQLGTTISTTNQEVTVTSTTTPSTTAMPTTPTTSITTTQPVTTVTVPSTTLDPRCPAVNINGVDVHLPHEYDCTKYYTCDWGLPVLMSCPATLHWSVALNRCDWPLVARCDETLELDPRCPFPQVADVMLPHETDCTKYYKCWWGLPDVFVCPINTHWSVATNRCEDPFVAQCDPAFITTRRTMPTAPTVTSTAPMERITFPIVK